MRAATILIVTVLRYTLHTRREAHPLRIALSVSAFEKDLLSRFKEVESIAHTVVPASRQTVAFMFSGQGSQYAGMGKALYESTVDGGHFRRFFDEACDALAFYLDASPRDLILNADERQMERPLLTQCGLFAVEYALASTLILFGIRPVAVAGHSIGEYAAAAIAGMLDLDDAARLIVARAQACESLAFDSTSGAFSDGMMLSVSGSMEVIEKWVSQRGDVWIAVQNLPDRVVLSGTVSTLKNAEATLTEYGCQCAFVAVSHPFHSPLMAPVAEHLAAAARGMTSRRPSIPMTSNITGTWIGEESTDSDYWQRHLLAPVRWTDNMQALLRWQPDIVLEIGPSNILTGLFNKLTSTLRETSSTPSPLVLATMRRRDDETTDASVFSDLLGKLWSEGIAIDWSSYHSNEITTAGVPLRSIELPTYAFDRHSYWTRPEASIYVEDVDTGLQQSIRATMGSEVVAKSNPATCLVRYQARREATVRIYCFPFAGGTSRFFQDWAQAAPDWLEVVAVELPGRNARADESLPGDHRSDQQLRRQLASLIRQDTGSGQFVLCGLSYGATLATELLLNELADLERNGQCKALMVVGRAPFMTVLSSDTDLDSDLDQYLLIPNEVRANTLWQQWYLPVLRADLEADRRAIARMNEVFSSQESSVLLHCDIVVQCGLSDPACSVAQANTWATLSSSLKNSIFNYSGGHEFILREKEKIFSRICDRLSDMDLVAGQNTPGLNVSPLYQLEWRALPIVLEPAASLGKTAMIELEPGAIHNTLKHVTNALAEGRIVGLICRQVVTTRDAIASSEALIVVLQELFDCDAKGELIVMLPVNGAGGILAGLIKSAAHETSALRLRILRCEDYPDLTTNRAVADWGEQRLYEVGAYTDESDILWNGDYLLAPRLCSVPTFPLMSGVLKNTDGYYLVTGGTGALGTALIDWLIKHQHISPEKLIVLSRNIPNALPKGVNHLICDLSDRIALCRTLERIERVRGIFHLAGMLEDCAFHNLNQSRLNRVLSPKLALEALLEHADRWKTRWIVAYSSTSALFGAPGQANYAAANAWIDQMAQCQTSPPRVFSIAWGTWSQIGMAADNARALQRAHADGETPLLPSAAMNALAAVMARVTGGSKISQYVVCDVDWNTALWSRTPLVADLRTVSCDGSDAAPARADLLESSSVAEHVPEPPIFPYFDSPASTPIDTTKSGNDPIREFLEDFIHHWDVDAELSALGLDSLDLVQIRNGFNKRFGTQVSVSVFAAPNVTLGQLWQQLGIFLEPVTA